MSRDDIRRIGTSVYELGFEHKMVTLRREHINITSHSLLSKTVPEPFAPSKANTNPDALWEDIETDDLYEENTVGS